MSFISVPQDIIQDHILPHIQSLRDLLSLRLTCKSVDETVRGLKVDISVNSSLCQIGFRTSGPIPASGLRFVEKFSNATLQFPHPTVKSLAVAQPVIDRISSFEFDNVPLDFDIVSTIFKAVPCSCVRFSISTALFSKSETDISDAFADFLERCNDSLEELHLESFPADVFYSARVNASLAACTRLRKLTLPMVEGVFTDTVDLVSPLANLKALTSFVMRVYDLDSQKRFDRECFSAHVVRTLLASVGPQLHKFRGVPFELMPREGLKNMHALKKLDIDTPMGTQGSAMVKCLLQSDLPALESLHIMRRDCYEDVDRKFRFTAAELHKLADAFPRLTDLEPGCDLELLLSEPRLLRGLRDVFPPSMDWLTQAAPHLVNATLCSCTARSSTVRCRRVLPCPR